MRKYTKETSNVRSPGRWLRSHPWLTLAALAGAVVTLSWIVLGGNQVTRSNFDRIQLGMSRADVHDLLGPPEFQVVESGLVDGPASYITNREQTDEERRRRGFRDYRREQWSSSEIEIVVISDLEGRVVCRYPGLG
jgi:hypothetical protein